MQGLGNNQLEPLNLLIWPTGGRGNQLFSAKSYKIL